MLGSSIYGNVGKTGVRELRRSSPTSASPTGISSTARRKRTTALNSLLSLREIRAKRQSKPLDLYGKPLDQPVSGTSRKAASSQEQGSSHKTSNGSRSKGCK